MATIAPAALAKLAKIIGVGSGAAYLGYTISDVAIGASPAFLSTNHPIHGKLGNGLS